MTAASALAEGYISGLLPLSFLPFFIYSSPQLSTSTLLSLPLRSFVNSSILIYHHLLYLNLRSSPLPQPTLISSTSTYKSLLSISPLPFCSSNATLGTVLWTANGKIRIQYIIKTGSTIRRQTLLWPGCLRRPCYNRPNVMSSRAFPKRLSITEATDIKVGRLTIKAINNMATRVTTTRPLHNGHRTMAAAASHFNRASNNRSRNLLGPNHSGFWASGLQKLKLLTVLTKAIYDIAA